MYRGHAGLSLLLFSPFMFIFRVIGADMKHLILACFLMVAISFVPDTDVLVKRMYRKAEHRGITHTFLFGFVVGVLFSVLLGYCFGSLGWPTGFLVGFGGTASHLLGDTFTREPPKVRPFYPFSDMELAFGLFKASDRMANNIMLVVGTIAFVISYGILSSISL